VAARVHAAAFLLSIVVPLCEVWLPTVPLARGSLAALALLPWLVLASMPGRCADPSTPAWRGAVSSGCLALPPLCLCAGIDLARGVDTRVLAPTAAAAWLVLVLWSLAAECAARAPQSRAAFAVLWFLLLPGASALRFSLAWVPLRASPEEPQRAPLFAADPLLWCHRWGRPAGLAQVELGELALALCAALLVAGVVLGLGRQARAEGAA